MLSTSMHDMDRAAHEQPKKKGKQLEDQVINRRRVIWLNHEQVKEKHRQRELHEEEERARKAAAKEARECQDGESCSESRARGGREAQAG